MVTQLNLFDAPTGVFEDRLVGEFCAQIEGEIVGWGETYTQAQTALNEALRVRREHAERCPGDYGLRLHVDY